MRKYVAPTIGKNSTSMIILTLPDSDLLSFTIAQISRLIVNHTIALARSTSGLGSSGLVVVDTRLLGKTSWQMAETSKKQSSATNINNIFVVVARTDSIVVFTPRVVIRMAVSQHNLIRRPKTSSRRTANPCKSISSVNPIRAFVSDLHSSSTRPRQLSGCRRRCITAMIRIESDLAWYSMRRRWRTLRSRLRET